MLLEGGTSFHDYVRARCDLLSLDRRTLPSRRVGDSVQALGAWVNQMQSNPDPGGDSPLLGPSTMQWYLGNVATHGTDMVARQHRWVTESSIKAHVAAVHEHNIFSLMIQHAVITDSLSIKNLVSF